MKNYCTQNDGDCKSCSLSSYSKDCENNKIGDEMENQNRTFGELKIGDHFVYIPMIRVDASAFIKINEKEAKSRKNNNIYRMLPEYKVKILNKS